MSGVIDKAKEMASNLTSGSDNSATGPSTGEFKKPEHYSSQTQRGADVGLQHEMKDELHMVHQEGENGLEVYKASGKLRGKKAIVTGGDSGIGGSAAILFAMEGADVAIIYKAEEEKDAQNISQLCQQYAGKPCLCYPIDIRDDAAVKVGIDAIAKQFGGRIDVLVNNAGVMYDTPTLEEITNEQFDLTVKTNIYGTFYVTRAAIKYIPKGGSIINTVSQVAYAGAPSLIDYSMTKAAGVGFTRALSQNLLEKGIRVNGVAPGPVWTPLQPAAMDKSKLDEWQKSPAPIGRIGQPVECGTAYVFLASADGSFFTGQVLHPNGGKVVNG